MYSFNKYQSMLEEVRRTLGQIVGPLQENDDVYECGEDCDCEDCKEKREMKKEAQMESKWIQKAIKHPGALRKKLGYSPDSDTPISSAKLNQAAHSNNPTTRKQAVLAKTLKKLNK